MISDTVEDYVAVMPKIVEVDLTKVLTVIEYAKKIGKSRQRVYQMIENGDLKPLKIAGKNYIIPS